MPQDYGLLDVARARDFYQTRFEQAAVEGRYLSAFGYFFINEMLPQNQDGLVVEVVLAAVPDHWIISSSKGCNSPGEMHSLDVMPWIAWLNVESLPV